MPITTDVRNVMAYMSWERKNMLEKIKAILGSVRFWIITTGSASAYLAFVEANGFTWSGLLNAVSIWLGVVVGIGTLDKLTETLSKK